MKNSNKFELAVGNRQRRVGFQGLPRTAVLLCRNLTSWIKMKTWSSWTTHLAGKSELPSFNNSLNLLLQSLDIMCMNAPHPLKEKITLPSLSISKTFYPKDTTNTSSKKKLCSHRKVCTDLKSDFKLFLKLLRK